jgi:uncharacterized protein (DUF305 family)
MRLTNTQILAAAFLAMMVAPAAAQDAHAGHDMSAEGMAGEMTMGMTHEMDQAHMDLMAGMDETNKQMMDSMMIEDIDVAFVCAMIPHHQGAINMAKAELAHGDNQWAKDMAQKVIAAQEQEIADMIAWLEGEGASE